MKEWFFNLRQGIKQDPIGSICALFFMLLIICVLFVFIGALYGVCTGKISQSSGKSIHGLRPMYIGKQLIFIPY